MRPVSAEVGAHVERVHRVPAENGHRRQLRPQHVEKGVRAALDRNQQTRTCTVRSV